MNSQPTVYVIDDEPTICSLLQQLLDSVALRSLCFNNALDFLRQLTPENHGCILVDIRLPGMSGLELQDRLLRRGVQTPVILLSGYADVDTVVQAFRAGAFDFIPKPFSNQFLLDRVQRAVQEDTDRWSRRERENVVRRRMEVLSRRERQVLDLVVEGHITKQIASLLHLSHKTVENHRTRIMQKMNADGVIDLVRQVLQVRNNSALPQRFEDKPLSTAAPVLTI